MSIVDLVIILFGAFVYKALSFGLWAVFVGTIVVIILVRVFVVREPWFERRPGP